MPRPAMRDIAELRSEIFQSHLRKTGRRVKLHGSERSFGMLLDPAQQRLLFGGQHMGTSFLFAAGRFVNGIVAQKKKFDKEGAKINRIKDYRIARGMTTKELGRRIGVSQSTASKYENSKMTITLATAFRLMDVLECTMEDLFPREGR